MITPRQQEQAPRTILRIRDDALFCPPRKPPFWHLPFWRERWNGQEGEEAQVFPSGIALVAAVGRFRARNRGVAHALRCGKVSQCGHLWQGDLRSAPRRGQETTAVNIVWSGNRRENRLIPGVGVPPSGGPSIPSKAA